MFEHFAKPTIKFCEDNLASGIAQPANSWSNLAFIAVGLYLIYISRGRKNVLLKLLGPITLLIGACSFFYHATYTYLGQFVDLGSMFVLGSCLLAFDLKRLNARYFTSQRTVATFLSLVLTSLALVYFVRIENFTIGLPVFGAQVLGIIFLEFKLYQKRLNDYKLHDLLAAIGFLLIAFVLWNLDLHRVWCDPDTFHIVNGHALWHMLNAVALLLIYTYHAQFD